VMPDMMSILGCSSSDVGEILHKLGFRLERVPLAPTEEKPPPGAAEAPAAEGTAAGEGLAGTEVASPAGEAGPAAPAESASASESDAAGEPLASDAAVALEEAGAAAEAALGEAAPAQVPEPPGEKTPERTAAEPRLDEIWRPRRQGRHPDRARRRAAGAAEPAKEDARPRRGGKEGRQGEARTGDHQPGGRPGGDGRHGEGRPKEGRPHKRHDRQERRQGAPGRREDRPQRPFRHSASPAPKAGIDPDSPFAALSSLKAALEKQSQE